MKNKFLSMFLVTVFLAGLISSSTASALTTRPLTLFPGYSDVNEGYALLAGNTYTSENLGFTVTLPQAWLDYGKIDESENRVAFYYSYSYDHPDPYFYSELEHDGYIFSLNKEPLTKMNREFLLDYVGGANDVIAVIDGYAYYWSRRGDGWGDGNPTHEAEWLALTDSEDSLKRSCRLLIEPNQSVNYLAYLDILKWNYDVYNTYIIYFLVDLDKNGTKELLVHHWSYDAEYTLDVYTIRNGKAEYVDEISAGRTTFFITENGDVYHFRMQMGYYTLSKITFDGSKVELAELFTGDISKDDFDVYEYFSSIGAQEIKFGGYEIRNGYRILQEQESQPSLTEKPSGWAKTDVNEAIGAGLAPQSMQSKYTQATTRAEFCALAVAMYEAVTGQEITERLSFSDTNDVNVEKMAALDVVNGVDNDIFAPNDTLTREQAATMLSRLSTALNKPLTKQSVTFVDGSSISAYAVEAVGQMQATGVMGGIGDNTFAPKNNYSREQSIVTILRLYNIVTGTNNNDSQEGTNWNKRLPEELSEIFGKTAGELLDSLTRPVDAYAEAVVGFQLSSGLYAYFPMYPYYDSGTETLRADAKPVMAGGAITHLIPGKNQVYIDEMEEIFGDAFRLVYSEGFGDYIYYGVLVMDGYSFTFEFEFIKLYPSPQTPIKEFLVSPVNG